MASVQIDAETLGNLVGVLAALAAKLTPQVAPAGGRAQEVGESGSGGVEKAGHGVGAVQAAKVEEKEVVGAGQVVPEVSDDGASEARGSDQGTSVTGGVGTGEGSDKASVGGAGGDSYATIAKRTTSVSGSESGVSWADAVEDELLAGEKQDEGWTVASGSAAAKGFFAEHVKTPRFAALEAELFRYSGHRLPKSARAELALAGYTAATVPNAFKDGRDRLRRLALVGDSALAAAVMSMSYRRNDSLAVMQAKKVDVLTDSFMSTKFAESRLAKHVVVAGSIELGATKTGATALEVFAGLLSLYSGTSAVNNYAVNMGLVPRRV